MLEIFRNFWSNNQKKKSNKIGKEQVINYSEEYEFCIGIVGIPKEDYFKLTPAETYTIVQAYIYNRDVMASNFRALFHLQYNQWAKKGQQKQAHKLWPLSIDKEKSEVEFETAEEMYEFNKKLIEAFKKSQNKS